MNLFESQAYTIITLICFHTFLPLPLRDPVHADALFVILSVLIDIGSTQQITKHMPI